mgnify:CR=1 FL=1
MPEPLDDTIFHLTMGIISPIVKSPYGYHIFKVSEKYPARTRTFEECKEDILADIRIQKEDAAFTAWLEELKRTRTFDLPVGPTNAPTPNANTAKTSNGTLITSGDSCG